MKPADSKKLGKQIALLRKARGLSQADLAEVSGIPITAIRRCEQSGSIPLDRYLVLASTLNATLRIVPEKNLATQPYRRIEDVIRSAEAPAKKAQEIRKPRLGGAFETINQPGRS